MLEMAPTAIVGMPTALRIASAKGVWYSRPYAGSPAGSTWPVETSMMSTPQCFAMSLSSIASDRLNPPSTQSVAEIRIDSGLVCGQASRTASVMRSRSRARFSSEPPWSSLRWFVTGDRNDDSR